MSLLISDQLHVPALSVGYNAKFASFLWTSVFGDTIVQRALLVLPFATCLGPS